MLYLFDATYYLSVLAVRFKVGRQGEEEREGVREGLEKREGTKGGHGGCDAPRVPVILYLICVFFLSQGRERKHLGDFLADYNDEKDDQKYYRCVRDHIVVLVM